MKTLKIIVATSLLASFSFANAQLPINANNGFPAWGVPVTTERYYYIPDIETYYDIPSREYIYLHNGVWVRSATVPTAYRNYDFHRGRKVVINDYRGNAPYAFYNVHRVKYVPAYRPHKAHKPHPYKHGSKPGRGHGHGHGHRY